MPEVKILRPKIPGFHAAIVSISTVPNKNQLGNIYRYDGKHFEKGFFKTVRFARQFMQAGQQLGKGWLVTIKPNFYEDDNFGRKCVRQWVCFNGENFIEMKTFRGVHLERIHSIKRSVDKIELPVVPNFIGEELT